MKKSIRTELLQHVLSTLTYIGEENYDSDELHYSAFNSHCYIVGHYNANKWLETHEVYAWECIDIVQEYEKSNFGVTNTPIHPENMVNMFVYIMGEDLLSEFDLDDYNHLVANIKAELEE